MHTEETPNPLARKFYADGPILQGPPLFFSDLSTENGRPLLAEDILSLPGVISLLITPEFLTVTKNPQVPWPLLESVIFSAIGHHQKNFPLTEKDCVPRETPAPLSPTQDTETDAPPQPTPYHDHLTPELRQHLENWVPPSEDIAALCQEIEELLETHIRPGVHADGGMISFQAFDNGVVYVRLQGACSGCPHSQITLQEGIEKTLRYYIPEVISVASF